MASGIWLRNIQLSFASALIATAMIGAHYDADDAAKGVFRNWDALVCAYVAWGSFGSLMAALVLKYADAILRTFGGAVAALIAACGSSLLLGFVLTPSFAVGALIEVLAEAMRLSESIVFNAMTP